MRGSLFWVASGVVVFQARVERRMYPNGLGTSKADSRFHFLYFSGGGMICVSYDICVYHFWFVSFSWGIPPLQSSWSLSYDHELEYAS